MKIGNSFRAAFVSAVAIAASTSACLGNEPEQEDGRKLPAVTALVPNFYYHDLASARKWYVEKLGLQPVSDWAWGVIVEVGPGMQIALVDGARGTLRPVDEKGTMLVIETEELEAWYRYVRQIEGIEWYRYDGNGDGAERGIREHEDIEEFRIVDPGGYIIEFYRWKPGYPR